MLEAVFWQSIVSPHMAHLADELGAQARVTYVAAVEMAPDRARQGWARPDLKNLRLRLLDGADAGACPLADFATDAVHLTEGVRGNGYVAAVIRSLRHRHARWGVMMETIDERSGRGPFKRLLYAWHLGRAAAQPDFVLAIGEKLKPWLVARGVPAEKIFEFAYFLPPMPGGLAFGAQPGKVFRLGFLGQMIQRKRVDVLIDALAGLLEFPFECVAIGTGPLEARLRARALAKLGPERFRLLGRLPMAEARACLGTLDCLVLPSDHDGWGAVVSEALMVGVPAICSDACGAAGVVRASGVGGVFPKGDVLALRAQLRRVFTQQPPGIEQRQALASWAHCLGSVAGARYLAAILDAVYHGAARPLPPWQAARDGCVSANDG